MNFLVALLIIIAGLVAIRIESLRRARMLGDIKIAVKRKISKRLLLLSAIALLAFLALSDNKSPDVTIYLDCSRSMDIDNRLVKSVTLAKKVVNANRDTSFGLKIFAGEINTVCPVTKQHDVLLELLEATALVGSHNGTTKLANVLSDLSTDNISWILTDGVINDKELSSAITQLKNTGKVVITLFPGAEGELSDGTVVPASNPEFSTALHEAILTDDFAKINRIIKSKANLHSFLIFLVVVLILASLAVKEKVVLLLLMLSFSAFSNEEQVIAIQNEVIQNKYMNFVNYPEQTLNAVMAEKAKVIALLKDEDAPEFLKKRLINLLWKEKILKSWQKMTPKQKVIMYEVVESAKIRDNENSEKYLRLLLKELDEQKGSECLKIWFNRVLTKYYYNQNLFYCCSVKLSATKQNSNISLTKDGMDSLKLHNRKTETSRRNILDKNRQDIVIPERLQLLKKESQQLYPDGNW